MYYRSTERLNGGNALKILIAEDDKDLRHLLYEQLTGEGYDVISASNGKEAYDMFVSESPDMAILLVIIVAFLLTQKKRLANRAMNMKKEKIRLCLRLVVLTLLLAICLKAPYLIGYNYMFVAVWLSYSVLIALSIIDLDLILLIVVSCLRYIRQKNSLK